MKKYLLISILAVVILGAGWFVRRELTPITYSNLTTEKALNQVVNALQYSGVSQQNIEVFEEQVKFTNDYLEELPGMQGDFTTIKGSVVKYDEYLAFNLFTKIKVPEDLNCRIAAWNLIKDVVEVENGTEEIEDTEEAALEYYPHTGFVGEDKANFGGLFKGISAGMLHTSRGYEKMIQDAWKQRGVVFEDSNRKLISCFAYNPDMKWIESVHAGVMLELEDEILFVEKWNLKAPFQVSRFKNERELKYYLKQRLANTFILNPTIMKNDELL